MSLDALVDWARCALDMKLPADFEGQRVAETLYSVLCTVVAVVALASGWWTQDPFTIVCTAAAGFTATALVVVPPWPFLRRHPVAWQPDSAHKARRVQ